jgi:beta-mannosidase
VQFEKSSGLYSLNTAIDIYRQGQFNNFIPDQSQPWIFNASLDFLGTLPACSTMRVSITDSQDAGSVLFSGPLQNVTSSNMTTTGTIVIDANAPKLWWPTSLGDQNLYIISVEVVDCSSKKSILVSTKRSGFRTIVLNTANVTESQIALGVTPGSNWHFEINGHEIYVKGSNLVPPDAFWPRVTPERMTLLFGSVMAQGQNMLRVWSSGAYLPDWIYDMADELGLLLWSEFEFSDTLYPDDDAFKESVTGEVTYNVRRLNHHPSLACWIGGNEFENLLLPIAEGARPGNVPLLPRAI